MNLPFPSSVLAQHIIALGKTRSGKSSKMRLIVEQLLEASEPVCIIDPKGDWWGLKSSADSKRAGYPIVIFGGEHADVPLNPRAGAAVAELIATGNRPSLIDLGGWMVGDRTRFFIEFASTLFKTTRGRRYLVIDEVHNFAPQGKVLDVDAGKMLHWANRIASEGSGKGITLIAASQRPQKVHKDLLTSCETLIACKVIHKLDRDAIKDWIDGCADLTLGKQVISELAGMERSEAWVWSPEAGFGPKRITFPLFRTYDSFKPQGADAPGKLKGWAEVDLEELRGKLASVVAEAEANDPAMLKKQIRELQAQLAQPRKLAVEDRVRAKALEEAEGRGFERGRVFAEKGARRAIAAYLKELRGAIHKAVEGAFALGRDASQLITVTTHPPARELKPATREALSSIAEAAAIAPRRAPSAAATSRPRGNGSGEVLTPGQRKVLTALIQHSGGLMRDKLTLLAGYKRSTRDLYLRQLARNGLIEEREDGRLHATDDGLLALPDAEPLPIGEALRSYWLSRLPPGERKILEILIEVHPLSLTRDVVGERAGYERSTRDLYIRHLQSRQLVPKSRGEVRAAEELFA